MIDDSPSSLRRDLFTYALSFGGLLAVPWSLHGFVHERSYAIYETLWRNLLGGGYRMPLENAKPITVLRAGLTNEPFYWIVAAAGFALLAPLLGRLSEKLWGRYELGVIGFVLVALGNSYVLPGPFLNGYWPLLYWPMVIGSLLLFAEERYGWAFALIGVSGLLRPESWGFAVVFLAVLWWTDRASFRPLYALALLCVPLWIAFDWALSGDPLYSFHMVRQYREYAPVDTLGWVGYWPGVWTDLTSYVSPWLLGAGVLGLGGNLWRGEGRRAHLALGMVALLPALAYWGVSAFTEIVLHVRFLSVSLVVFLFYAAALPALASRWWTSDQTAIRWAVGAGWAALLIALAGPVQTWELTEERSREAHMKEKTRANAIELLREDWLDTDWTLLTGRSIDVFALELGPKASQRMHQLRVVGSDPESLQEISPGLYVGISNDMGGYASRFQFLEEPQAHQRYGVRFLPFKVIQGPEGPNGLAYRYVAD